jgi:hypothetical protein
VTFTLEDFRGDVRRAPRRGRRTPTPEPDDLQRGDRVQRRARPLLPRHPSGQLARAQPDRSAQTTDDLDPFAAIPAPSDAGGCPPPGTYLPAAGDEGWLHVAVVVDGRRALGYLCDGHVIGHWLSGTIEHGHMRADGPRGSCLDAQVDPEQVWGSATAAGFEPVSSRPGRRRLKTAASTAPRTIPNRASRSAGSPSRTAPAGSPPIATGG